MSETYLTNKDSVTKLVNEIFGEDRVFSTGSNSSFNLYIHFPEVEIRNSRGGRRTINDLIVKMLVNNYGAHSLGLDCQGSVFSPDLYAADAGYAHSHLPRCQFGTFSHFCLGASVFASMIVDLSVNPTELNWTKVLLGLPRYLSWESLEGGPYIRMSEVGGPRNQNNMNLLEQELKRLLPGIPKECWDFTHRLTIIADHPALYDYFNQNSTIKRLTGTYTTAQLTERKAHLERHFSSLFLWKPGTPEEKQWRMRVKTDGIVGDDQKNINKDVVDGYVQLLEKYSKRYIKRLSYEQYKERGKKIFDKVGAL